MRLSLLQPCTAGSISCELKLDLGLKALATLIISFVLLTDTIVNVHNCGAYACHGSTRTLPSEVQIYLFIPWRSPYLICFVLMRYTTLLAISLGLKATWHRQEGECLPFLEICTLLVQFSVSTALGWRTVAIWHKDPRIIVIIFLLLTTLMVFSALLILSFKPQRLWNGTCVLVEDGNYAFFSLAWFYAGTVVYDTIVIVLSTCCLWRRHTSEEVPDCVRGDDANAANSSNNDEAYRIHPQRNRIRLLLFRMTSNGVLYLSISTVFNIVCCIVVYHNQEHAQDLLILYSSVMWIVCQRLVLLEIKATWRRRLASDEWKDTEKDETDKLIARILQTSWSAKAPPSMTGKAYLAGAEDKAQELVLSLSVDSCLKSAPVPGCTGCASLARTARISSSFSPSPSRRDLMDAELSTSSVQQLHDFRLPSPVTTFDQPGIGSSLGSHRTDVFDASTCESALIPRNEHHAGDDQGESGVKRRLGALRQTNSPSKLLAGFAKSTRSEAVSDTALAPATTATTSSTTTGAAATRTTITTPAAAAARGDSTDHPLKTWSPLHGARDSTSLRLQCRSPAHDRAWTSTSSVPAAPIASSYGCSYGYRCQTAFKHDRAADTGASTIKQSRARDTLSALEVADMLANMSDDDKMTALELAGMQGVLPSHGVSCDPPTRAERKRPTWIIHPPL